jgi:hypothetical protein
MMNNNSLKRLNVGDSQFFAQGTGLIVPKVFLPFSKFAAPAEKCTSHASYLCPYATCFPKSPHGPLLSSQFLATALKKPLAFKKKESEGFETDCLVKVYFTTSNRWMVVRSS